MKRMFNSKNKLVMSLEQQISTGIMEAMKAKDTVRLSALRNAKKYIIEAKTAGPEIAELADDDVLKIIIETRQAGHRLGGDFRGAEPRGPGGRGAGAGGRLPGIPA